MSYILDALKKSEQERNAGNIPNLQTNHAGIYSPPASRRPLWVMLLSLAIGVNLVLLVYVMIRPADEPPAVAAPEFKIPANILQQSTENKTATMNKFLNPQSTNEAEPQTQASQVPFSMSPMQRTQTENTPSYNSSPDPVHELNHYENLVSLYELPEHIRQYIPHMEFTVHVYSETPSQRLLIINGAERDEGEEISNTLKLVEITPGGAIFTSQDYFFEIGVLQDWSFK